jgi:hypothetical protein
MQIQPLNATLRYNNYQNQGNPFKQQNAKQPQFTGMNSPISKGYNKFADWIARNYYVRFYNSKFAKSFIEHTRGPAWNNMTTHMSALGSTLISGMYAVRTLQNDKLDPEKKKTLALNDILTWGISTLGSYFLDAKLGDRCERLTKRFVADYLLDHPNAKRPRTLGNWEPKNIGTMMEKWPELVNARIDRINAKISSPEYKGARKLLQHVEGKASSSIRDFNLDVLKNRRLTTLIDGIGVLKSLFVFGMVYRYLVPVLVMKPANMIGHYFHDKKAAQQAKETSTQKA